MVKALYRAVFEKFNPFNKDEPRKENSPSSRFENNR
jgi:hypothetical protein